LHSFKAIIYFDCKIPILLHLIVRCSECRVKAIDFLVAIPPALQSVSQFLPPSDPVDFSVHSFALETIMHSGTFAKQLKLPAPSI
jgi:hypothetical protein